MKISSLKGQEEARRQAGNRKRKREQKKEREREKGFSGYDRQD